MEVPLIDCNRQAVLYEVCGCGQVEVPLEGLQQEELHVQEALLGQHQVHGAHAAQAVQRLQLRHPVFSLLKLTCRVKAGAFTT